MPKANIIKRIPRIALKALLVELVVEATAINCSVSLWPISRMALESACIILLLALRASGFLPG